MLGPDSLLHRRIVNLLRESGIGLSEAEQIAGRLISLFLSFVNRRLI
jgi:hypothetical protein